MHVHLTAIAHYEKKEQSEKVEKHTESLLQLLEHQMTNESIPKYAYYTLKGNADSLLRKWQ